MQAFLLTLLTYSVTTSAAALVFVAASPLTTKWFTAKSRYYMWLIIVIGLLIPFRPSFGKAAVEISVPAAAPTAISSVNFAPQADADTLRALADPSIGVISDHTAVSILWWDVAAIVWAAGAAISLAYFIISHLRYMRAARRLSETVTDGPAYELLQELRKENGGPKNVALYECSCIDSPVTMGLFRHRILLPHTSFDADELRYILSHELTHLRRGDLWYKALTLAASAIHWFNPVVYLTRKTIDLLCEISCDDEIVRGADADARVRYAETIIGVVRYQTKQKFALSTGFYTSRRRVKTRISSIMDIGKKKMGAALLCAALVVTAGSGFAFAATAAVPVQVPDDYRARAGDPAVSLDILSNWKTTGSFVQHNPMEGQISEEQAYTIAKDAASRYMRQLTAESVEFDIEMIPVNAVLGQHRPEGFEQEPDAPEYSQWEVYLRSADGISDMLVFIHAVTGAAFRVETNDMIVNVDLEVNADKLRSGFMADWGFGGSEYDEENSISVRELVGLGYQASSAYIGDSKARVEAAMVSRPYLRDGESFDKLSYLSFVVSLLSPDAE